MSRSAPGLLRRNRAFRLLWSARAVSLLGDRCSLVALPFLALRETDATPGQVALLFALQALPGALLAIPAAAHLVGRSERAVMVACDAVRALTLGGVFALAAHGSLTLWHLVAAVVLVAVAGSFFDVAGQAYLPRAVDRADYLPANSRLAQAASAADVVGPVLAGLLIGFAGTRTAILADAASYVLSAALLAAMGDAPRPAETEAEEEAARELSLFARAREGVAFVAAHPALRALVTAIALFNLGGATVGSLWFPFLYDGLDLSPSLAGTLITVGGVSALLAALAAGRVLSRASPRTALPAAFCTAVLALWLVPAAGVTHPVACLAVYQLVFSSAAVFLGIAAATLRQTATPLERQGRVYAAVYALSLIAVPAGGALAGLMASVTSEVGAITLGAAIASTSLLALPALSRAARPAQAAVSPQG
ncbi:MFS transporter [Streptomyces capparidis]